MSAVQGKVFAMSGTMSEDESTALWIGILIGALASMMFTSIVWKARLEIGHDYLGSKGHACFANNTCREGLRCLVADGIQPTCVKP